jgi:hypothetical protein
VSARAGHAGGLSAARALQEQEQAILDQIAARVAHEPGVRLLMTIPRVRLMTAATLWAKPGDPRRFPGPQQVGRYAGLDPSVDQSGERAVGVASAGTGTASSGGPWSKPPGSWPGTTGGPCEVFGQHGPEERSQR